MDIIRTLPQAQWPDRLATLLSAALVLLGGGSMLGWWLQSGALLQPVAGMPAIKFNSALALALIGLVLLGLERKIKPARWLALVPLVLCALTGLQSLFGANWHLDELLAKDHLSFLEPNPGRMAISSAFLLAVISGLLCWRGQGTENKTRLLLEALVASLACAAGVSSLLGRIAGLPAIYSGDSALVSSPVSAIGMILLGAVLLTLAWRDAFAEEQKPPAWTAIPAIVLCLTLTFVLWIGLREREQAYLSARTQTAMDGLAVQIGAELEHQVSELEKIARRWGDAGKVNPVIWEADAATLMTMAQANGCVSIAFVSPEFRVTWSFSGKSNANTTPGQGPPTPRSPQYSPHDSFTLDHAGVPERLAALQQIAHANQLNPNAFAAVISASTNIDAKGDGFVIYAPVITQGKLFGFVAADFIYARFFRSLIADRVKLEGNYDAAIQINNHVVFNSNQLDSSLRTTSLTLDRAYTIADRRIRLYLTPSADALARDRRYLPELALIFGIGITILIGISVHLARRARTGQHDAESSNRRLLAENEERRRVEERLKTSDERLRLALDSTQIGIFEWHIGGQRVEYSPGLWVMLGYDPGRMPASAEAWQSLIHPDDLPSFIKLRDQQLAGQVEFIEPEYRVRAQTGQWHWVSVRARSVGMLSDGPTRIIGTVQDISARREAESALRQSQTETRKLSLVAAKTDNPVVICSPDGAIEWTNESFVRVMEYTLDEVAGRNLATLLAGPETNPRTVAQIRAATTNGQGLTTDLVNYSKSGRKYHLHLESQPVHNEHGKLVNFILILNDITTRVATEDQLRRAKTEADATSRAKSEFLASMSHEIRTPMNGVIGMTSLLMETTLTGEQRDFVNTIRTSGEALLTIINDILDFSKIESGKLELEHLPFDLGLCLEEAFDLFAMQASAKKLELTFHIGPDVPPWIVSDVTRLRQIVVNLVNNAVKFTPSGSIAVVVRTNGEATEQGRLIEFAVRDTGIGIPPDRLDRLFKAFSQVDSSTTRKYGGTGLGLAIAQRLCALMGGDIRVESTPGAGSVFTFSIRAQIAELPADHSLPAAPAELLAGTVLCVEPHPVTAARWQAFFDRWQAPCRIAHDLGETVAILASLRTPVSLFVINVDETGDDSPLVQWPEIAAPRLLVLPFGQTAPTDLPDAINIATTYKPLKTAALVHAVRQLFNPQEAGLRSGQRKLDHRTLAEKIPLDVLLAEDNTVNQKVALRFLERLGYRADAVGNGLEAVTAVQSRHYHLVFMDIQMPEMDGFEAGRQIRRRLPADRQPRIVALTANAMQGDREQCLAAGMDDYISKPVKLHDIDAVIRRLFDSGSTSPLLPEGGGRDYTSV
ncbi:MAG: PAS domain S-box protein [Opitutaceae bacterium]|nr:PAS domain S-box protein [Opitutaceae bacterium]